MEVWATWAWTWMDMDMGIDMVKDMGNITTELDFPANCEKDVPPSIAESVKNHPRRNPST